jgi:hypothetical protein
VTVSHTTAFSAMSVFILNKSKNTQTVTINIPTFAGDPTNNSKWVYQPGTVDEWSQSLTYEKSLITDLSSVSSASVNVPPLSCTVYDFN